MKNNSFYFVIILFLLIYSLNIYAQSPWPSQSRNLLESAGPPVDFNHIQKKPGHYTAEDWATAIDTTWGEGLLTEDKLELFDYAWDCFDKNYAAFQNLDVDWQALYDLYRPEIAAGVSRGRFVAIMNHLSFALQDLHSYLVYFPVNMETPLYPGVPLFHIGTKYNTNHFGATLTPLPDSTLIVIKVLPEHPLGLVPGDIILGYDGIPWKRLYKLLLKAQLPFHAYFPWGSTKSAIEHVLLSSAGMNWHLFDTLDVIKYTSSDTVHFPTGLLAGQTGFIWGNEQLPVPGVPWVRESGDDIILPEQLGDYVSWGIVEEKQIGYIYILAESSDWQSNISEQFKNAVDSLMNIYVTKGLILDFRLNYGGKSSVSDEGISLLFNNYIETVNTSERCGEDHFQMCPKNLSHYFAIKGNPTSFYDKPIAVLTGPHAGSAGDHFPLKFKFHPMARFFGKPTAGAYGNFYNLNPLGYIDWLWSYASTNAYFISNPGNYLIHTELEMDEDIWLTQEDVAKGEDTVVKRAIEWIENLAYAHDVTVDKTYLNPGIDSVLITATVENPNQHELSVIAEIKNMDNVFIDSLSLFDDGMHGDSAANDNLWANFYLPTAEHSFKVSVTTNDLTDETSRTLPNVAWFTTIGPVVLETFAVTPPDTIPNPGDELNIKLTLKNLSLTTSTPYIKARITSLDTLASVSRDVELHFGSIDPGESVAPMFGTFGITINEYSRVKVATLFRVEILSNKIHFWSDTLSIFINEITGGIADIENAIPLDFALDQNYPNPFNPSTVISWQLTISSDVDLSIFNLLGQKVATLISRKQRAGYHQVEWDASAFASGIYYYRIEAGEFQDVKKMILIK